MNDRDISVLVFLRDGYLDIVSRDLSFLYNEEKIRSAFNNEINMLQFIIENINKPKTIEENPYFHAWIDDTIEKHRLAKSLELPTILKLKQYVAN